MFRKKTVFSFVIIFTIIYFTTSADDKQYFRYK
jgi:hypothetical protein